LFVAQARKLVEGDDSGRLLSRVKFDDH